MGLIWHKTNFKFTLVCRVLNAHLGIATLYSGNIHTENYTLGCSNEGGGLVKAKAAYEFLIGMMKLQMFQIVKTTLPFCGSSIFGEATG